MIVVPFYLELASDEQWLRVEKALRDLKVCFFTADKLESQLAWAAYHMLAVKIEGGYSSVATTAHHCHAVGCEVTVPPKMHMCLTHWRMAPKPVQDLIWKHYRSGQEVDKNPSIEYICTAFVSISCVALLEGKPLPTMTAI